MKSIPKFFGIKFYAEDNEKYLTIEQQSIFLAFISSQYGIVNDAKLIIPKNMKASVVIENYNMTLTPKHYAKIQQIAGVVQLMAREESRIKRLYYGAAINLLFTAFCKIPDSNGNSVKNFAWEMKRQRAYNHFFIPAQWTNSLIFGFTEHYLSHRGELENDKA